jgi:hypothetical protein
MAEPLTIAFASGADGRRTLDRRRARLGDGGPGSQGAGERVFGNRPPRTRPR